MFGCIDLQACNPSHWFIPFFPAKANAFWGEDYYFQLLFRSIFSSHCSGYHILNPNQYGITRAPLPALCKKVVKSAEAICHTNSHELFEANWETKFTESSGLTFAPNQCIESSIKTLQSLIQNNVDRHKKGIKASYETPLLAAHAWANGLAFNNTLYATHEEAPNDAAFLEILIQQIDLIKDKGHLKPYQQTILTKVCKHLHEKQFIGTLAMATGTGKTYMEISLAIAALLAGVITGTTRPIIIVTPYKQLVDQAYKDFMELLRSFPESPIHPVQVVKVDSDESSISAELLLENRTLDKKACIYIFCQDSYTQLLRSEDEAAQRYQNPCMLLIDESHLQTAIIKKLITLNPQSCFIAQLSATPKESLLFDSKTSFFIEYGRETAMANNYLTPCILDTFDCSYSSENVLRVMDQLPELLTNNITPNGVKLTEQKGIIYVPNSKRTINYSRHLKSILEKAHISCFEINADEPYSQKNLHVYKAHSNYNSPTKILICKGMAKVGFSDNALSWVIYLQNGDAAAFCQSAGRAMRLLNEEKVAYLLAFEDVDSTLVFKNPNVTADKSALARATEAYQQQRERIHGMITIPDRDYESDDSSQYSPDEGDFPPSPLRRKAQNDEENYEYGPAVRSPLIRYGLFTMSPSINSLQIGSKRTPISFDPPLQNDYEIQTTILEAHVTGYTNAMINYEHYLFPYEGLHALVENLYKFADTGIQSQLLSRVVENILIPMVDHNPKLQETIEAIQEKAQEVQKKGAEYIA